MGCDATRTCGVTTWVASVARAPRPAQSVVLVALSLVLLPRGDDPSGEGPSAGPGLSLAVPGGDPPDPPLSSRCPRRVVLVAALLGRRPLRSRRDRLKGHGCAARWAPSDPQSDGQLQYLKLQYIFESACIYLKLRCTLALLHWAK
jgi:hypothetical protein